MFGYLTASPEGLTEEQFSRYKACYCGLCRSLEKQHGQLSRLTLNYDMSFLMLLLNSLYEPEETAGEDRCLRHPGKPRPWSGGETADYAAHMNVALAYLKRLDDWEDDGSINALAQARLLKGAYERIKHDYPRQCAAMERGIDELRDIEKQKLEAPDRAAACFGAMLEELFIYRQDRWEKTLRPMANALGRFVYLLDACMDLDADAIRGRYNPFRRYYGLPDNPGRFRDILKMQLGECVFYFDRLPLVQDAYLLKNILCVGLWTQFDKKYGGKDS